MRRSGWSEFGNCGRRLRVANGRGHVNIGSAFFEKINERQNKAGYRLEKLGPTPPQEVREFIALDFQEYPLKHEIPVEANTGHKISLLTRPARTTDARGRRERAGEGALCLFCSTHNTIVSCSPVFP
jgi:hypothetical protein